MPTNSKSKLAMNNSIVKVEVKEERMEAETVEASLPAQDLEVKVEPMISRSESVHFPSSVHFFIFHDGVSLIPLLSLIFQVAIRKAEY
jgi:hypothetical protein